MKINDLYASVTNRIVAELEAGAAPWIRPWRNGKTAGIMPQNAATGRPYSGVNILLLWADREANGWATPGYMTFQQALAKGACVRKGEKGAPIIFTKSITVEDDDEDRKVRMARTFYVFNVAQIDGLKPDAPPAQEAPQRPETAVDAFVRIALPAKHIRIWQSSL